MTSLVTVHLHGALGKRFGPLHQYDVQNAGEAGRALAATIPGLRQYMAEKYYRIVRGDSEKGITLGEDELSFAMGKQRHLHVIPAPEGAKKGGVVKLVLGAVFVAAAIAVSGGTLAGLGAALPGALGAAGITGAQVALLGVGIALTGVASMLTPSPKPPATTEAPAQRPSFIFTGPVNRTEEGGVVPVVYGRMRVGSVLVSGSLSIERLQ